MVVLICAQLDHRDMWQSGSKPEVAEDVFFPRIENVNVVCWFNSIFFSFAYLNLQKTKIQVHLSQNERVGVGPVVHKGVHLYNPVFTE